MRTRALVVPLLLSTALVVPATPAHAVQAAGAEVTVADMAFSPARVKVGLGRGVTWTFEEGPHTTTSDQGFWDSGTMGAGDGYGRSFDSAGTFGYHCTIHSMMHGKVAVPLKATGSPGNGWTLRWATGAAGSGRDYDVQVKAPGATRWRSLKSNTTVASTSFDPAGTGTWKVRARTSNTDAGKSSGWSPVKAVTVS